MCVCVDFIFIIKYVPSFCLYVCISVLLLPVLCVYLSIYCYSCHSKLFFLHYPLLLLLLLLLHLLLLLLLHIHNLYYLILPHSYVHVLTLSESDNLGSTDSEVKKILSLHMPISEYDTLGSDSEGPGTRDSPPTFAESAGLAHAHIHPHPAHSSRSRPESAVSQLRSSTDIFKHRVRSRQQGKSGWMRVFKGGKSG